MLHKLLCILLDKWLKTINLQVLPKSLTINSLSMHWWINLKCFCFWFHIWDISITCKSLYSFRSSDTLVAVKLDTPFVQPVSVWKLNHTEYNPHETYDSPKYTTTHSEMLLNVKIMCVPAALIQTLSFSQVWMSFDYIGLSYGHSISRVRFSYAKLNKQLRGTIQLSKIALSKLLWQYLNWRAPLWIFILNPPHSKTFDGIWSN